MGRVRVDRAEAVEEGMVVDGTADSTVHTQAGQTEEAVEVEKRDAEIQDPLQPFLPLLPSDFPWKK